MAAKTLKAARDERVVSHIVAALKSALDRIQVLEAVIVSDDKELLHAERAAIMEFHRGPVEVA